MLCYIMLCYIILHNIILHYIAFYCIILHYIALLHYISYIIFSYIFYFSRMRSKGSRFTLGVWGLRVCSLGVAFTVATVRNRPCEDRMAVPMVSSAEVVIFGGFQRFVASFRVAGVALRDIQTCFVTCRKSFCVAGAILLRRFQKMRSFFVAGAALWTCPSSFFVAGAAL